MGAPAMYLSTLRIAIIAKHSSSGLCLVTDGVNGISTTTLNTAKSFLATTQYSRWIVLLNGYDPLADSLLLTYHSNK